MLLSRCGGKTLALGPSAVGWLNAAIGAGGLAGGAAAAALVRVSRLGRSFIGGLLLWGLPLTVLALTPGPAVAGLALAAVGIGNAVEDVGVFTLVARAVNARVVGRVLCAKEFVAQAGLSAGSLACGDCFGEIALLRDIPRTATIMAEQPMRTLAIGRQPFLVAVAGNSLSSAAADALVTRRLAADRPAVAGGGAVLGVPWLNR